MDLEVKDWNKYNDSINNSRKRIDPNDQIYNFIINNILRYKQCRTDYVTFNKKKKDGDHKHWPKQNTNEMTGTGDDRKDKNVRGGLDIAIPRHVIKVREAVGSIILKI